MSVAAPVRASAAMGERTELAPTLLLGASAEFRLLLACARTRLEEHHRASIEQLLSGRLDWEHLSRAAARHGLVPLLYWHLGREYAAAVPQPVLQNLRRSCERTSHHNLFLADTLIKLVNLFQAHGIAAIPYKGPTLTVMLYGNLALREFADLDLLVRTTDLPRAKSLVLTEGYELENPLSPAEEQAFLHAECEYELLKPDPETRVELHWQIVPRYLAVDFDPERFWEDLGQVTLAGGQLPSLSPENLLLVLCVHAAKHLWDSLSMVCDIAELLRSSPELRWSALLEQAGILGIRRILFLSLALATDLLDARILPEMKAQVSVDPVVTAMAAQLAQQFRQEPGTESELRRARLSLRMRERWRDRARCLWRILFTPGHQDFLYYHLPDKFAWCYPGLRVLRLTGKFLRECGSRAWTQPEPQK